VIKIDRRKRLTQFSMRHLMPDNLFLRRVMPSNSHKSAHNVRASSGTSSDQCAALIRDGGARNSVVIDRKQAQQAGKLSLALSHSIPHEAAPVTRPHMMSGRRRGRSALPERADELRQYRFSHYSASADKQDAFVGTSLEFACDVNFRVGLADPPTMDGPPVSRVETPG